MYVCTCLLWYVCMYVCVCNNYVEGNSAACVLMLVLYTVRAYERCTVVAWRGGWFSACVISSQCLSWNLILACLNGRLCGSIA